MHTADELLAAGAEFVAIWPQELITHLLDDPTAAVTCSVSRSARTVAAAPAPLDLARRAAASRRDQRVASAAALGHGTNGHACGCETCATKAAPAAAPLRDQTNGGRGNGHTVAVLAVDPVLREAVARMVNGKH
jgi:phosphoglycolate phosphatase